MLKDFGSIADTVYINQQKSNFWFHMIASGGTDHTQPKTLPLSTSEFFFLKHTFCISSSLTGHCLFVSSNSHSTGIYLETILKFLL